MTTVPTPAEEATTPTPLDLSALKQSLTAGQRNGRSCYRCGSTERPLVPAGKLLDVDVVECDVHRWERDNQASPPLWLTGPCPAWCEEKHRGSDHPDDRKHHGGTLSVPLLTIAFENFGTRDEPRLAPVELLADLMQHHREAEPRVVLGDTSDTFSRYLSLGEAQRFAFDLVELVAAGRTGTDVQTLPAPGGAAGCQPWCAKEHDPGCPELCLAENEPVPVSGSPADAFVGLSHHPDDGTVIDVDSALHLTVDEAEVLVLALLRQIRRAHLKAA
ncbi:hypothetical protein Ssi03_46000 [Sphaerisporangium siamense]|uniref:Uncharacterized protein n=1 Tax=Sphaerisporangium siamense TaxID=795645 RepID=A0A7W7G869_9ACTN|nr:hypothetical protein [Sphaerisporangium siamense]MBB4699264.1 hypothetical protein [Sphaerisporangium siamense]GII86610.1 hypothetical protein Ssi03_46000 [Sphaerisporangium siamense]